MAKGIQLEGVSVQSIVKNIKYLLVPLVISSLSRIDTLTVSMEGIAFGLYEKRTYRFSQRLTRKDKVMLATFPLFLLLLYFAFH